MDPAFISAIDALEAQKKPLLEELASKNKLINGLCRAAGEPEKYPDSETFGSETTSQFRADHFFGQPLATSTRLILERRKAMGLGAIPLIELCEILKSGGYAFDNSNEAIARRNVAITLGKNPAFMKVPGSGNVGLAEWYPNAKRKATATELAEKYTTETKDETLTDEEAVDKGLDESAKATEGQDKA
jgi:hypothetical protein